jgi:PAS domain S-box-containing protein
MNKTPVLELREIFLNYGSVNALKNINLTFYESEIHAIVGEHGAGKSSIGLITSGFLKPSSGRIFWKNSSSYEYLTLKQSRKLGIEMVPQHSSFFEDFSIAENLFINNPTVDVLSLSNRKKFMHTAMNFLEEIHIPLNPLELLRNLPLPEKTLVDVLKHIYVNPKVLILDEALEKLTASSLTKILPILKKLKNEGSTIVFITHRIDDIYEYADQVTIIRKGELLITDSAQNIDKINLIKLAYTQIPKEETLKHVSSEFYQLLKYNQAILEKLPVNLIVTDKDQQIKLFNEQAIQYFEIKRDDFYNMPLESLFAERNEELFTRIEAALNEKDGKILDDQPIYIHGTVKMSHITINPIFDGNFQIGNMIILEDITERQKLREQIMFSEKLASVGILAAGVAHEINNPLEILENCIDYLNLELTDQEQVKALKDIEDVKNSIAQIVSNLVSFSDTRTNVSELFDVNELIGEIINLVKHYSKHRNTTISFHHHNCIHINANKNEIKQVIINLIKNSFEAISDGGDIIISTNLISQAQAEFAEITVRDTGCGIKADNPSDIFLPFYSTKKISGKNLGLGLYMSYTLMKNNHGDITVKNLDEGGCQFTILLPAYIGNHHQVS